jgi:hypothetical protein
MSHEIVTVGSSEISPERRSIVVQTLHGVLDSVYFRRSKRYPALLEYLVSHTLDGNHDALQERAVAVEVFGRSTDYEPSADSVVRNSVGEVRKRLALYFAEHPGAEVRIDLPHGGYAAEFVFQPQLVNENSKEHQDALTFAPPVTARNWRTRLRWIFVSAASALILVFLTTIAVKRLTTAPPLDRFWAPLLVRGSQVTIALGNPEEHAPKQSDITSPDNALIKYMNQMPNAPILDVTAGSSIDNFLARRGTKPVIQMDKSIQLSDLQRSPAVLIGASQMNPWIARLSSDLRFQFNEINGGHVHSIVDTRNPSSVNWKLDVDLPFDQIPRDYALITRQLNPNTGQWWVGIGGTSAISTGQATNLVLDPAAMKKIESQLPSGWDWKNLQVVIEINLVNGNAGSWRVAAFDVR